MKNKKVFPSIFLVLLFTCVIAIFGFTNKAQDDQNPETIIVKASQINTKDYSLIRIYYGNDKIEKIQLEKLMKIESEVNNFNTIVTTLNKLNEQGYEVVSATELAIATGNVSTYVMKRKR